MNAIGMYYMFRNEGKFVVVSDSEYSRLTDILEEYGVNSAIIAKKAIPSQHLPVECMMMAADYSSGDYAFAEKAEEELLDYLLGDQSHHLDKEIFYGKGE